MTADQLAPEFDDETLVAYLDGELPDEEVARFEQRLANDHALQRQLKTMQQSWDLLDELPRVEPKLKLAESTIELVTLSILQQRHTSRWSQLARYRWPLLAVAMLLMFCVGSLWARARSLTQADQLLRDLPLLVRYDQFRSIDSSQWLQRLAQIQHLVAAGLPLSSHLEFPPVPNQPQAIAQWVASLPPNHKLQLQENYRAFRAEPEKRQVDIRRMNDMLTSSSDIDYDQILTAYAGLVSQISSTELAQIEANSSLDHRAAEIQQVVYRELAIAYAAQLTAAEVEGIRRWAIAMKEKNFEYFFGLEDPEIELVRLLDEDANSSIIQPQDRQQLVDLLEQSSRELLQHLDEELRPSVLHLWVYTALPSTRPRPQVSAEQLQQQFDRLPQQRQNELIYLPSSDVVRILTDELDLSSSLNQSTLP
ncbi:MAG: hypothetical protein KF752_06460 [Pirellulaceae bacterium]|nr:hypothetical protein [Pirellulaceae bacterium]